MSGRLEGKTVLVTGAAGSIGQATAQRLAAEGARLMLADLESKPLEALCDAIAGKGGIRPEAFVYDASSNESSADLVDRTLTATGRLDAVCNIAGIYTKARTTDVTDADWQRMLQINLSSVFVILRQAIPHLAKTGGCVVNTSSLAALEGHAYLAAYAVSKAGIVALTKSLAAEYASTGIRFNAVCPGAIRSSMSSVPTVPDADPDLAFRRTKLKGFDGGLGAPEDVAAAFAYLVSGDARYVSGSVLVIDGGQFLL